MKLASEDFGLGKKQKRLRGMGAGRSESLRRSGGEDSVETHGHWGFLNSCAKPFWEMSRSLVWF